MCGKPQNWLSNYLVRGKLATVGDKIDLDHPINKEFLEKWQEKSTGEVVEVSETAPVIQAEGSKKGDVGSKKSGYRSLNDIEREKKEADLELVRVATRLKLLDEQKKAGENVPTEGVKVIISQLTKSLITNFHVAAENFLVEIAKLKDLSNEELATMRGRLVQGINSSSDRAIEQAKVQVKQLVKEISIKRGVGEHD